jgi:hypothetical protein
VSTSALLSCNVKPSEGLTIRRDARPFGGPQMTVRSSRRRVRALRARDHLGWGFVWLVLWVLFILVVLIPLAGTR